jgi:hypothetical protein
VLFASLLALVMLAAVSSWRCSEPWSVRRLRGRSLLAGVVVVLSIGSPMTAAAAATSTVDTSKIAAHVAQYAYDTAAAEHQLASPDPQELPGPVMSAATRRRPPQSEAGADVSTTLAATVVATNNVNLSTAGRTAEEAAAINEYAARSNTWLAANGPARIQSTDGALRAEASAA